MTLDENLLNTLGLGVGDFVCIELDTENEAVLITRAPVDKADQIPLRGTRAKR